MWVDHDSDLLDLDHLNEPVANAIVRTAERERAGHYPASLPSPANRKLIRERAGWMQQQVADHLQISRHTVVKWEHWPGGIKTVNFPVGNQQVRCVRPIPTCSSCFSTTRNSPVRRGLTLHEVSWRCLSSLFKPHHPASTPAPRHRDEENR